MKMIRVENLNGTKVLEKIDRAAFDRFFEEELTYPAYSRTEYRNFLLNNQYSEVREIAENCARAMIDKRLIASSRLSHKLMVVAKYADEDVYKMFLEEEGEDIEPRVIVQEHIDLLGRVEIEEFSTEYKASLQRYNEYLEKNQCKGIESIFSVYHLEAERSNVYDTQWMLYVSKFLSYADIKENLEIIDRIENVKRISVDDWLKVIAKDETNGDAARAYMLWADGVFHLQYMDGSIYENDSEDDYEDDTDYEYDVYLSDFDFFESLMIGLYKVKALVTSDETREICRNDERCKKFANKMNKFVDYLITSDFFNDVSKRFY